MSVQHVSRRDFLKASVAAATLSGSWGSFASDEKSSFPPTRQITHGPRHHWFGYYDKLQFDPTSRYVLSMEVTFEHRSPRADDTIKIGMVDLERKDKWTDLGQSNAWCWQQGCMLQWLPGSKSKIIWNDLVKDQFVSRILDVHTGAGRTVPHPVYSVSPDGQSAVAPDFRRIQDLRPGYGYPGPDDPYEADPAPKDSGIFHIDLATGESKLIISLHDIARIGEIPDNQNGIKHYFNHLLFNPDGSRFIALHRWRYPKSNRRLTRMITANPDGSDIRVVIPNGYASHFIWRDTKHILSQSKNWLGNRNWGDFLFEDKHGGGNVEEIGHGVLDGSGHLTYLPGNEWILNDTYPKGKNRIQTPHLYHVKTGKRIDLGHFHLPKVYNGEWRVDTHPRFSPNSKYVCIDAPVKNEGRQLHLIDIGEIVKA